MAAGGDTLAMGAPFHGPDAHGAVFVYERRAGAWRRTAHLMGHAMSQFGSSVALDGDHLAVGAVGARLIDDEDGGAVYVYERGAAGWQRAVEILGPVDSDAFGIDVALDGDTLLVGAGFGTEGLDGQPGPAAKPGSAYVYRKIGDSWDNEATLESPTRAPGDGFGEAVALTGDTAVVAAELGRAGGRPEVFVFTRSSSRWQITGELGSPGQEIRA